MGSFQWFRELNERKASASAANGRWSAREDGETHGHFLQIFAPAQLATTLLGSVLCTGMLGGYYAVTTGLPTCLKTVRHLSVFNTSGLVPARNEGQGARRRHGRGRPGNRRRTCPPLCGLHCTMSPNMLQYRPSPSHSLRPA